MILRKRLLVEVFILLLFFVFSQKAVGQEVEIVKENFEGYYANATTSHSWNGGVWWNGSNNGSSFVKVENNAGNGALFFKKYSTSSWTVPESIWQPETFDVSSYESVSFQFNAKNRPGASNARRKGNSGKYTYYGYFILEYNIDNLGWQEIKKVEGDLSDQIINSNSIIGRISGNSLDIRVKAVSYTGYTVNYAIDDFVLKGELKIQPPHVGQPPQQVLWLRADKGIPSSTTTSISRWDDRSGNSNNAYSKDSEDAYSSTIRNTYNNNSLNYNPGIEFDQQHYMSIPNHATLGLNRMSIFSVIKPTSTGQYDAIIAKHDINYEDGYGIQYFPDGGSLKFIINPDNPDIYTNNSAGLDISINPHIVGGIYDKTQIKFFTESNSDVFSYSQDVEQNNAPLTLGGDHTNTGNIDVFEGDINEVMIYNYAVSDDEKNAIESYLAIKYGITLNHDYVLSDGTIAYDLDNIYKYDIVGLARDDQWWLNQKISSSINKTSGDVSNLVLSMDNSFNKLNKDSFIAQLSNKQSLVCGKNNGDISSWISEGDYKHVGERWKVQKNMTNYWTYIQLNLSSYPAVDNGYSYHLILDNDETTANGIIKTIPLNKSGDLYNCAVDFPDGLSYISVGYEVYEPFSFKLIDVVKPSSNGATDASFKFKITGGNASYRVSVSGVYDGEYGENEEIVIDNQGSGEKIITIEDASGRLASMNYYIPVAPEVITSNSGGTSDCASGMLTKTISVTNPNDFCADFSISDAHILLADKDEINLNSNHPKRTIMFWFKTSTDITSQQFLYKEGGGTNGLGFYIKNGFLYVNIWKSKKSAGDMKTDLIKPNSWHHVALTWDQYGTTNERYKAYIDGNLINSLQGVNLINHPADIWFGAVDQAVLQDNTKLSGGAKNFFAGQMDDFKLWNNTLTQDQVRSEMNISTKSSISNLVVQYDFNDTSLGFNDISDSGYDANAIGGSIPYKSLYSVNWADGTIGFSREVTVTSTTEFPYTLINEKGGSIQDKVRLELTDANKFMTAEPLIKQPCKNNENGSIDLRIPCPMHFDGNPTKQRIDCGSKFMDNRTAFTMEAWMRFDTNNMNSGGKYSFFGQDDTIEFGIYSTSPNKFHIWTTRGGGAYFPLSVYPTDMQWHHLAVVGTGTQYILYVDGVEVGRQSHTGIGAGTYGAGHSSSNNVFIGGSVFDPLTSASNSFEGDILKVGFWSKALSQIELKSIFDNNTDYTGQENGLVAGYNFYETEGNILNPAGEGNTHIGTISSESGHPLPAWDSHTFLWNNGATSKKIENVSAGVYTVEVSLSQGCLLTKQYTIAEANVLLNATIDVPDSACDGQTIEISANATGGFGEYKYIFYEGTQALVESTEDKYNKSIIYNSTSPRIPFKVKVTDGNGCYVISDVKELNSHPKVVTKSISRK